MAINFSMSGLNWRTWRLEPRNITLNLGILAFLGIPILPGITSNRLSPLLVLFFIAIFILKRRISYDQKLILPLILYVLLFGSLSAELLVDFRLFLQFTTAISCLLLFLFLSANLPRKVNLYLCLGLFISSGLLFFHEMLLGPLLGYSRLDILLWQRETSFLFGINKYLLGIFILNSILVFTSNKHDFLKIALPLAYLFSAFFLGSRTHMVLSSLLLFFSVYGYKDYLVQEYRFGIHTVIVSLVLVGSFILGSYFEQNLLPRLFNLFFAFEDTHRGRILGVVISCYRDSSYLFGNAIASCARSSVSDFDNSFLFVLAGGGVASIVLFFLTVGFNLGALFHSALRLPEKYYLAGSYIILLNVDVLVSKAFMFFPLMIYMLNPKRSGDSSAEISVSDFWPALSSRTGSNPD